QLQSNPSAASRLPTPRYTFSFSLSVRLMSATRRYSSGSLGRKAKKRHGVQTLACPRLRMKTRLKPELHALLSKGSKRVSDALPAATRCHLREVFPRFATRFA